VNVFRVLAPNPGPFTLEGTNTWIVGSGPSVVIDPGPEDPAHVQTVAREAGAVAAIVVTHGHPDHAPGAPLLAELTGAPIVTVDQGKGRRRVKEDEEIAVDGWRLRAVRTPGHSADHIAFFEEESGSLFTGDAVLGRGTTVIAPPDGDLAAYMTSLERMKDLAPRTIFPGHGPTVFDGPAKLEEYIEHRVMRETQVVEALRDGRQTIPEMVEVIYSEYPKELQEAAGQQVKAQLEKLEHERRVERRGERYELVEPRTCERCGRRPAIGKGHYCGQCSLALLQEKPTS
jgi:glyoxylase-like metal-dependent hydrolase (beta-lactamase superfamily II)